MEHDIRRKDRQLTDAEAWKLLETGYVGRLGTAGPDGWPYVVPKMYAVVNGAVYFHGAMAPGHTRANVEANPNVCFEVDQPGPVFPTGDKDLCQTSVAFESVILFGTCTEVTDPAEKIACFEALMAKYADPAWVRPARWASADVTAVWRVSVDRITGKQRPVAVAEQWKDTFWK